MRILIVSHTAGSRKHGMLFRPFYMAREFVVLGHEATIVSASYFHTRYLNPTVHSELQEESLDRVRFLWVRTPKYTSEAMRALGMLVFAGKVFWKAPAIAARLAPDVVIATSPDPFVVFGAWRIAKRSGAAFVFEFRDIWPLTLVDLGGKSKWHPFILLLSAAERFALRNADLVVSVLDRADRYLKEIGNTPRRFAVIPNGVSLTEWQERKSGGTSPLRTKIEELRATPAFVLGYVGHHGVATALFPLVEAMAQLRNEAVIAVLVGDGQEKPSLQARASELGLKNVLFLDPVPKSDIVDAVAAFDACYVGSQPTGLYKYGLSFNKVFDYMMAARPVVSAINAESDPIVAANCGVKARAQDPSAIAEAIRQMAQLPEDQRQQLGANGRAFVVRQHAYSALASRYVDELRAILR